MKKLATLSLVVLFTISCTAQWGKKVNGNGKMVTIERSTGDYDAIAVSGWFDVDLVDLALQARKRVEIKHRL